MITCTKPLSITINPSCLEEFKIDWTPAVYDLANNSVLSFLTTPDLLDVDSSQQIIRWDSPAMFSASTYINPVEFEFLPAIHTVKYNSLVHASVVNLSGLSLYGIVINNCPSLQTVQFNVLQDVNYFRLSTTAVVSFTLPALQTMLYGMDVLLNNSIQSIILPSLTSTPYLGLHFNPQLQNISIPSFVPVDGGIYQFNENALTETCVDAILSIMAAEPAFVTGQVILDGGTNSPPSAAGLIDAAILAGRGVTVTNN